MWALIIVLTETQNEITVAYSIENDCLDGRLVYNKLDQSLKILRQCTNEGYHAMYGPIRARLRNRNFIIGEKTPIAIG